MDISNCIFFDIECVGTEDERIIDILHPLEKKTADQAPKNYKNPEAIEKWIEREYKKAIEERENASKMGALDIDSARIVSIAWATGNGEIKCSIKGSEVETLRLFISEWNSFTSKNKDAVSVGYNQKNYDWSVIKRRMALLGLNSWLLNKPDMNRYYGEMDLMDIAYNFGFAAGKTKSLKVLADIFNIKPLVEGATGADIPDMTPKEIAEYNKSDVHLLREIFKKLNGIYF